MEVFIYHMKVKGQETIIKQHFVVSQLLALDWLHLNPLNVKRYVPPEQNLMMVDAR